ncbi:MAG: NYN domain-containing protein [Lachnospiraceae bacterium]|nr:NYN domain-containing protein [Lachnospiraceae bacterium]
MLFGRKKSKGKMTAALFVDFEHWYYGYQNRFNMEPDVKEWVQEIKDRYEVTDLEIFGDFSKNSGMSAQYDMLVKSFPGIHHTPSKKVGVEKDFTDFIILDSIYRIAARKKRPEVVVLFTGDAHFTHAVNYLKELNITVIVYGVKGGMSAMIKSAAHSYVEMPREDQEMQFYYDLILKSLDILDRKHKIATYWKTIGYVSKKNGIAKERIKLALDQLIDQKYVVSFEKYLKGKKVKAIKCDFKKARADGIWK